MGQSRKDVLNGWKEIANYVGRDPRTVERWEKQRGLPVHRVPGAGRATVYAHVVELDQWFASARRDYVESPDTPALANATVEPPAEGASETTDAAFNLRETAPSFPAPYSPVATSAESITLPVATGAISRWQVRAAAACAVVCACGLGGWLIAHHLGSPRPAATATSINKATGKYSFNAANTTPGVPYPSVVPGVDELYLRGVYSFEQRTHDSLEKSEKYFKEATAKDPNFAPAYVGLSDTYNLMREYSVMPEAQAYTQAKAAAERAAALDPNLPQAHSSLGFIDFFWLRDPTASEREFKRALQLDPAQAQAHHWYGSVLTHEGRFTEALDQLNMAQRLQPTSEAILCSRALALGLSGHRSEAFDALQELSTAAPTAVSPHRMLAILSASEPHDIPRWLKEWRQVAEMRHDTEQLEIMAAADRGFHSGGEHAMWAAYKEALERLHPTPEPKPYAVADAEANLGNRDAAFAILTSLIRGHDPAVMAIAMDPSLQPLHSDPRFAAVLEQLGIPTSVPTRAR